MTRFAALSLAGSALLAACGPGEREAWPVRHADAQQPVAPPSAGPGPAALAGKAPRADALAAASESRRTALVEATERVAPAVVSIHQTARQRIQPRTPWDLFFVPEGGERVVEGYGTGFIVRQDGIIITNPGDPPGAGTAAGQRRGLRRAG